MYRQEKSLAVRMIYKFSTLLQGFSVFTTSATHGNRIAGYLRVSPMRKYPAGSTVNQKRATRNKAKKFVIKDGVLHYIAKEIFLCRFPVPPSDDHL